MTRAGMEVLQRELSDWKLVKRPVMVKQLQEARGHGDLSENAEYHAAREELLRIDKKIHQLEGTIQSAVLVDESAVKTDQVRLFTRVRVLDAANDREREFIIVSPAEADPVEGRISHTSPVGQGLLGRKVGEDVDIVIPAGTVQWRILDIRSIQDR